MALFWQRSDAAGLDNPPEDDDDEGQKKFLRPKAFVSCIIAPEQPSICDGAAVTVSGDRCVIFGGRVDDEATNECSEFAQDKWTPLLTKAPPSPRVGHSIVRYDGGVLLYGGETPKGYDKKIYYLDLNTKTWTPFDDKKGPAPRAYASLCRWGRYCVLFGGVGADEKPLNDLWHLDHEGKRFRWHQRITKSMPAPRQHHAAVALTGKMFLFGGKEQKSTDLQKVDVLDLVSHEWTLVETQGQGPRCAHVLAHVIGGGPLEKKNAASICVVSRSHLEANAVFNDVYLLQDPLSTPIWVSLQLDWLSDWTLIPAFRKNHFSCAHERTGQLLIFGGTSHGFPADTVISLDLAQAAGLTAEEEDAAQDADNNNRSFRLQRDGQDTDHDNVESLAGLHFAERPHI